MTDSSTPAATPPLRDASGRRVRWYQRRPPAELGAFPRVLWWSGHAQLFIGFALALVGPLVVVFALNAPDSGMFPALGLLLFAMALPFACSGLLLRRYAGTRILREGSTLTRVLVTAAVVACIAGLSIAFVFVDVLLLLWVVSGVSSALY